MARKRKDELLAEPAAGNGILNRRIFLERTLLAGAAGIGAGASGALAEPLTVPRWSKEPGGNFTAYGVPSHFEDKVVRTWAAPNNPATPASRVRSRKMRRLRMPLPAAGSATSSSLRFLPIDALLGEVVGSVPGSVA